MSTHANHLALSGFHELLQTRVEVLLYILARDHLPTGVIARLLRDHVQVVSLENLPRYSSETMAAWAEEMRGRMERLGDE